MEKLNQEDAVLRENYDILKNQFDIVLQDSNSFFKVSDNDFVSYIDPEKTLEQGTTLRLEFTDTVE